MQGKKTFRKTLPTLKDSHHFIYSRCTPSRRPENPTSQDDGPIQTGIHHTMPNTPRSPENTEK